MGGRLCHVLLTYVLKTAHILFHLCLFHLGKGTVTGVNSNTPRVKRLRKYPHFYCFSYMSSCISLIKSDLVVTIKI